MGLYCGHELSTGLLLLGWSLLSFSFSFLIINLLLVSRLCLLWAVPDRENGNAFNSCQHELHLA